MKVQLKLIRWEDGGKEWPNEPFLVNETIDAELDLSEEDAEKFQRIVAARFVPIFKLTGSAL